MIYGLGTDIIEIKRIEAAILRFGQRFLERIFTEGEREYCSQFAHPAPHFAVRFAGKEAVIKALGVTTPVGWKEIEILNDRTRKPYVEFSPRLNYDMGVNKKAIITLSHCRDYATATALIVSLKEETWTTTNLSS